jgi:hypothetical protein
MESGHDNVGKLSGEINRSLPKRVTISYFRVKYYHRTATAEAILREGVRDHEDSYMFVGWCRSSPGCY